MRLRYPQSYAGRALHFKSRTSSAAMTRVYPAPGLGVIYFAPGRGFLKEM